MNYAFMIAGGFLVSSLVNGGAIFLASVVSFGLYFCVSIDDGGGYSFVIVVLFAFLSFSFPPPFPFLFFCIKDIEARGGSLIDLRSWCSFIFYIFRYLYLVLISQGKAWAPLVLYLRWLDPFFQLYISFLNKEFLIWHC